VQVFFLNVVYNFFSVLRGSSSAWESTRQAQAAFNGLFGLGEAEDGTTLVVLSSLLPWLPRCRGFKSRLPHYFCCLFFASLFLVNFIFLF